MASPVAQLVKNPPANAEDTRDMGSISGSGRSPGEGNGNLCHYSCLENPTDGGVCRATVYGVAKSWTQLSMPTHKLFKFWAPQNLNLLLQWCLIYNSSKPKQSQSWYACVRAQLLSHVWFFCDPVDWSLPGASVHGISQARIPQWVAISFFRVKVLWLWANVFFIWLFYFSHATVPASGAKRKRWWLFDCTSSCMGPFRNA